MENKSIFIYRHGWSSFRKLFLYYLYFFFKLHYYTSLALKNTLSYAMTATFIAGISRAHVYTTKMPCFIETILE